MMKNGVLERLEQLPLIKRKLASMQLSADRKGKHSELLAWRLYRDEFKSRKLSTGLDFKEGTWQSLGITMPESFGNDLAFPGLERAAQSLISLSKVCFT